MTGIETKVVDDWLRRLKWALASMPSPEREDIVAETRAHLQDRIDAGQSAAEALAPFGEADGYARSFLDEMELEGVLARPRFIALLGTIARRAHKSLVAAVAFVVVLCLGAAALGVATTAVWKLTDPEHAGLWTGPGSFFFGINDDPSQMRELLGAWVFPVSVLILGLCWVVGRLVLIWAVRTIRRRR
jgi:uncharacterized membrane protein